MLVASSVAAVDEPMAVEEDPDEAEIVAKAAEKAVVIEDHVIVQEEDQEMTSERAGLPQMPSRRKILHRRLSHERRQHQVFPRQ